MVNHCDLSSQADVIEHELVFPSFLTIPPGIHVKPIETWEDYGVWLPQAGKSLEISQHSPVLATPCDNNDTRLVLVGHPFAGITFEEKEEARRTKRRHADHRKKDAAGRPGFRVTKEECWLIGYDSSWQEPEGTSKSDYDESIPPFTRLLSATRDFEYSRHAEFQFTRSKRLFQLLRNAFGLRPSFKGNHWPGSGPRGFEYVAPTGHLSQGTEYASFQDHDQQPHADEICVLLTDPETCVRGILALARREAEAGWDFEPAYKFTVITAAFMSFLVYYDVLPEATLAPALKRACDVARSAPQALLDAKTLEDQLGIGTGWNRANWTLFGGSWGGAERGGPERDRISWTEPNVGQEDSHKKADDGGWYVEPIADNRPVPLTKEEACPHLMPFVQPLILKDISLIEYIPYARRRVVAILPPVAQQHGIPVYATRCHRLVTVPAPWTPKEKWRTRDTHKDDSDIDEEVTDITTSLPLDREKATIDEPDHVIIWVEGLEDASLANRLIGAGLRGRWGLVGLRNGSEEEYTQWWAFKSKDYVLPSFWDSPHNAAS
ncbi:hypothetical protein I302_106965 [Kwoniella bestiolae CBS 10118]|uniref:Uncharacterized protein n=1 Tax=Kwoniella bestiolae CBS 10118 TaxID=1296100 RepID=A0A1B9FZW3_9TREE|nr:hypothetical protein I302_05773 [Kwoniella bestiolae CBS 10118]OCF24314.1 hypothetical protein I302_05773 [Kwoniella bestiolae CBS 10118]